MVVKELVVEEFELVVEEFELEELVLEELSWW